MNFRILPPARLIDISLFDTAYHQTIQCQEESLRFAWLSHESSCALGADNPKRISYWCTGFTPLLGGRLRRRGRGFASHAMRLPNGY